MNFEFMHPGGRESENLYGGIKPEIIDYARIYLQMIVDGEIKSMNISRDDAKSYIRKLNDGTLSRFSVEAFGYNYIDYLEVKNGK